MIIFVLIVVATAAALITAAFSFVYGIIFDMHMKKISDSGAKEKKKWIVPRKMTLIFFCAIVFVGFAVSLPIFLSTIDLKHASMFDIVGFDFSNSYVDLSEKQPSAGISKGPNVVSQKENVQITRVVYVKGGNTVFGFIKNLEQEDVTVYAHAIDDLNIKYDTCKYYKNPGGDNMVYFTYRIQSHHNGRFRVVIGYAYGDGYDYKEKGFSGLEDYVDQTYQPV